MMNLEGNQAVSHAYADLVSGDWEFDGLDHCDRMSRIHAIINLMDGLMKTGWIEHTNDWDWRISVVWGDTKHVAGTYDGEDLVNYDDASWTDTISLTHPDEGDWAKNTDLIVTEFHNDDAEGQDHHDVLVPIAQIRTITIGEA